MEELKKIIVDLEEKNQELETTIIDKRNRHKQEYQSKHDQCWEILYGPNRLSLVKDSDEEKLENPDMVETFNLEE